MKNIKYVSLDMWDTLITPNRNHGAKRNDWLAKKTGRSLKEISLCYQEIKEELNHPMDGIQKDCYELMGKVFGITDIDEARQAFNTSFLMALPNVLPETVRAIKDMRAKGIKVGIGSNTNFIPGSTLKDYVLAANDLYFDFYVFSDEIGYAKPGKHFFEKTMEFSGAKDRKEVCHIGDDQLNDFEGATRFGIHAIKIDKVTDLPKVLATF